MGENKMRAKKEIPIEKQVEKLASYGLTNKEIAEALGFDDSTLKRKFENFLTKGKANLKQRLKRKQIDVALGGNVSMLIWLGKQYLGQADKLDENGEFEIVINRKTIDERSETKDVK
jgi:DNA-binding CsgD family transcriptional regulator